MAEFQAVADRFAGCHKADDALFMVGVLGMQAFKAAFDPADLDRALIAYERLGRDHPESTLADDAQYYCGEIHLIKGERGPAIQSFQKAAGFRSGDMAQKARQRLSDLAQNPDLGAVPAPALAAKNAGAEEKNEEVKGQPTPGAPVPVMDLQAGEIAAPAPAPAPVPENPAIIEEDVPPSNLGGGLRPATPLLDAAPVAGDPEGARVPPPASPPAPSAPVAHLLDLRYWSNQDYTRVVVELDREVPYDPPHLLKPDPELGTPPRLYIDFQGAVIASSMKQGTPEPGCYTLPIGDGLLKKARAGQYEPFVTRVVLDIERIDHFNAFPMAGDNFRYVIDVYGEPGKGEARGGERGAREEAKKTTKPGTDQIAKKPALQAGKKKTLVVIDAGHGGRDPGAVGPSGLKEKDITLAIAHKVKRELERRRPDLQVVLTRKDDRYLTLVERTAMANTMNADLFVSIHCNASTNRDANGAETYYLDNTTDHASLRLAAKENFAREEEMADTRDVTNKILADLITASKVEDSVPLARTLQRSLVKELNKGYGVADHGVKKAPFWVLTGATMPCALVEVSFISNKKEEKRLRSSDYQQAAASSIASGIISYLDSYPQLTLAHE
ncbi:MAG TPA: N-acetylmuramoyl-L-alanine amidase [bacterium]|nr:N-acetylmuramoyl-L-alanine amidase [bacterium]